MVNGCKKGKQAERNFANKLELLIGIKLTRNLNQSRSGGHDLEGIPCLAIEVKDHTTLKLPAWWAQTVKQAQDIDRIPMLAYNVPNKGWRIRLPLHSVVGRIEEDFSLDGTFEVRLEAFATLYFRFWDEP